MGSHRVIRRWGNGKTPSHWCEQCHRWRDQDRFPMLLQGRSEVCEDCVSLEWWVSEGHSRVRREAEAGYVQGDNPITKKIEKRLRSMAPGEAIAVRDLGSTITERKRVRWLVGVMPGYEIRIYTRSRGDMDMVVREGDAASGDDGWDLE